MRQLLFVAALLFLAPPAMAEPPRVVATTKPIHALVAAVMGELGAPVLLVKGAASPHVYSLRPSDAAALQDAGLVFWTGRGMEVFLEDSLATLAPRAATVDLSQARSIELLPIREGGTFEPHEDEHENEGEPAHEHENENEEGDRLELDMHYWLDPVNAVHMVQAIAEALAAADPENADTYAGNAAAAIDDLNRLRDEIEARIAQVTESRFIVFHDAYQYFERRFSLEATGSLTVTPDTMPGARRVAELRARIIERQADCVFAEPQFEPAIVATLIEGTPARAGTLDPEGANLAEGPGLYRQLLLGLADGFVACLGASR